MDGWMIRLVDLMRLCGGLMDGPLWTDWTTMDDGWMDDVSEGREGGR